MEGSERRKYLEATAANDDVSLFPIFFCVGVLPHLIRTLHISHPDPHAELKTSFIHPLTRMPTFRRPSPSPSPSPTRSLTESMSMRTTSLEFDRAKDAAGSVVSVDFEFDRGRYRDPSEDPSFPGLDDLDLDLDGAQFGFGNGRTGGSGPSANTTTPTRAKVNAKIPSSAPYATHDEEDESTEDGGSDRDTNADEDEDEGDEEERIIPIASSPPFSNLAPSGLSPTSPLSPLSPNSLSASVTSFDSRRSRSRGIHLHIDGASATHSATRSTRSRSRRRAIISSSNDAANMSSLGATVASASASSLKSNAIAIPTTPAAIAKGENPEYDAFPHVRVQPRNVDPDVDAYAKDDQEPTDLPSPRRSGSEDDPLAYLNLDFDPDIYPTVERREKAGANADPNPDPRADLALPFPEWRFEILKRAKKANARWLRLEREVGMSSSSSGEDYEGRYLEEERVDKGRSQLESTESWEPYPRLNSSETPENWTPPLSPPTTIGTPVKDSAQGEKERAGKRDKLMSGMGKVKVRGRMLKRRIMRISRVQYDLGPSVYPPPSTPPPPRAQSSLHHPARSPPSSDLHVSSVLPSPPKYTRATSSSAPEFTKTSASTPPQPSSLPNAPSSSQDSQAPQISLPRLWSPTVPEPKETSQDSDPASEIEWENWTADTDRSRAPIGDCLDLDEYRMVGSSSQRSRRRGRANADSSDDDVGHGGWDELNYDQSYSAEGGGEADESGVLVNWDDLEGNEINSTGNLSPRNAGSIGGNGREKIVMSDTEVIHRRRKSKWKGPLKHPKHPQPQSLVSSISSSGGRERLRKRPSGSFLGGGAGRESAETSHGSSPTSPSPVAIGDPRSPRVNRNSRQVQPRHQPRDSRSSYSQAHTGSTHAYTVAERPSMSYSTGTGAGSRQSEDGDRVAAGVGPSVLKGSRTASYSSASSFSPSQPNNSTKTDTHPQKTKVPRPSSSRTPSASNATTTTTTIETGPRSITTFGSKTTYGNGPPLMGGDTRGASKTRRPSTAGAIAESSTSRSRAFAEPERVSFDLSTQPLQPSSFNLGQGNLLDPEPRRQPSIALLAATQSGLYSPFSSSSSTSPPQAPVAGGGSAQPGYGRFGAHRLGKGKERETDNQDISYDVPTAAAASDGISGHRYPEDEDESQRFRTEIRREGHAKRSSSLIPALKMPKIGSKGLGSGPLSPKSVASTAASTSLSASAQGQMLSHSASHLSSSSSSSSINRVAQSQSTHPSSSLGPSSTPLAISTSGSLYPPMQQSSLAVDPSINLPSGTGSIGSAVGRKKIGGLARGFSQIKRVVASQFDDALDFVEGK